MFARIILFLCLQAAFAFSSSSDYVPYEFNSLVSGGSGCKDSASVNYQFYGRGIKVQFTDFYVVAQGPGELDRRTCNLAVPVRVKPGVRIKLPTYSVTGEANIVKDSHATIKYEGFYAGKLDGKQKSVNLSGEVDFTFYESNLLAKDFLSSWTSCGEDVNLRFNVSILAKNSRSGPFSFIKIRDIFIQPLEWEKC